jgi:nucleoside-triphosphatase
MKIKNILFTGPPRCGKSTLIHKIVLAHERIKSRWRVGKYGVNLSDIEKIAVPSMMPATSDQLVVIDEIGKMECFSELFKKTLEGVLDSDLPVIGSIALKGDRFIQKIKERSDVLLVTVTPQNRDELVNMYLKFNR